MDLKTAIKRARIKKNPLGADAMTSFMLDVAETKLEELFNEVKPALTDEATKAARTVAATIKKGDKGDKGDSIVGPKGDKGDSVPGENGQDGADGEDGADGKDGKDGESIIGDKGKDGNEVTRKAIISKINEKPEVIQIKSIKGLENYLKNLQRAIREAAQGGGKMVHGGGMTLTAGTNVTLVRNSNGTWTVSASGGGSSSLATEQVTAVASGTDVTIDLTQLAHMLVTALFVTRNGQVLMPNGNANLPGSSWSKSGTVITVYNADPSDIYLIQYGY